MKPRVSVVVPAWNEADKLPRLLDALDACEPAPHEIVVVDGGSGDATRAVADGRAIVIEARRGRASQQNAGARRATGDVLWFVHADCVPEPSALAEIVRSLADGAPGGCFEIAFPRAERAAHPLLPIIEAGINLRTRATRRGTGDQGIFVRTEVFTAGGGFPEWPLFEDVALADALRRAGRPAVCRGPLWTSARRWLRHGPVRTTALMWTMRIGFRAGVDPARLARHWRAEI